MKLARTLLPIPKSKNGTGERMDDISERICAVSSLARPRSWAVYGRSGAGKTTFASTFPKPILLLDIKDQGTDSVADVKGMDVLEVEHWSDIEDIYWHLYDNTKGYKTVIFDTVTQLQQVCLHHVLTEKRKDTSRAGDWGSLSRNEWGDASAMMKEQITNFRDLPLEVVFIAQEKVSVEDEEGSDPETLLVPEVGPAVMKSVAGHLNASVSIIGHSFVKLRRYKKEVKGKKIDIEQVRYCLRIGPNPVYVTKVRKPRSIEPPAFIEDPTYDDVLEAIKGE